MIKNNKTEMWAEYLVKERKDTDRAPLDKLQTALVVLILHKRPL